jgi:hypothetical protein
MSCSAKYDLSVAIAVIGAPQWWHVGGSSAVRSPAIPAIWWRFAARAIAARASRRLAYSRERTIRLAVES